MNANKKKMCMLKKRIEKKIPHSSISGLIFSLKSTKFNGKIQRENVWKK